MDDRAPHTYDEVEYPTYPQTHADRLATLATLFGMQPAPVEASRVLELGCGDGGNLIPMAFALPDSEFVGIDVAARPVAKGQATVDALGLRNITLRRLDVMELSPALGSFDYVIAHGLYSWVPGAVRERILAVCKAHLTPHGVAHVSYNAYPGSHLRAMVREMMRFHVRHLETPSERISQARALVRFLSESPSASAGYRAFLTEQLRRVLDLADGSLYHDDLADINTPVYFHDFVADAARHGLQYLAEADFFEMQDAGLPPPMREALEPLTSERLIAKEQYMDFLKGRGFRETLLCHEEVRLDRRLTAAHMTVFHVASAIRSVSPAPDVQSASLEEFRGPKGATLSTDRPLAKAALLSLSEVWPQSLRFDELLSRARARLRPGTAGEASRTEDAEALGDVILKAYGANLVELHVHRPQFVLAAGERPFASPLARWQARHGPVVTTLRHTSVRVEDDLARHLLLLLDGTRDRPTLVMDLASLVGLGTIVLPAAADPREIARRLPGELEASLRRLASLALLMA